MEPNDDDTNAVTSTASPRSKRRWSLSDVQNNWPFRRLEVPKHVLEKLHRQATKATAPDLEDALW